LRILADENVAGETVEVLRSRGHEIVWIAEESPAIADREVLARAQSEDRVVVTFDKDFGELAVRLGLAAASGVVLLRVRQLSPAFVTRIVVAGLESRDDWRGHFWVIDESRVRSVPLGRLPGA
jgi:predicted nuclease of predicted toxin-antitoxin system